MMRSFSFLLSLSEQPEVEAATLTSKVKYCEGDKRLCRRAKNQSYWKVPDLL